MMDLDRKVVLDTLTQEVEKMTYELDRIEIVNRFDAVIADCERMQKDCERIATTLSIIEDSLLAAQQIAENNRKIAEIEYDAACRLFGVRIWDRKGMKK